MDRVFSYFPFLAVLVVVVNGIIFRARARRLAGNDEVAQREYRTVITGFVVGIGGWFLLQGLGIAGDLVGAYRIPAGQAARITPYDWFLTALVIFINIRLALWVYWEGGAEILARCRGLFDRFPTTPSGVRLLMGAVLLGSALGLASLLRSGVGG